MGISWSHSVSDWQNWFKGGNKGNDENDDYNTLVTRVTEAVTQGDVDALEALQEEVPATVYGGLGYIQCSPPVFVLAALHGHKSVLEYLLKLQVDADATDVCGMTALHEACKHGHQECIELLVSESKDIDAQDIWGRTPLIKALVYRHLQAAKFLLQQGANPNAVDNYGLTPLTTAINYNLMDMVKLLLQHGADINQISCHHHHQCLGPPLYRAINSQNPNLVRELLHLGASTQPCQKHVLSFPFGGVGNNSPSWPNIGLAELSEHPFTHLLQHENAAVMAMSELVKRGGHQLNIVSLDIFMQVLAAHGLPLGPAHEVLTRALLASRGSEYVLQVPVLHALEQQSPFLSSNMVTMLLLKLYLCSGSCQDPESLEEITGATNLSTTAAAATGIHRRLADQVPGNQTTSAGGREGRPSRKRKVVSLHTQARRSVRKLMMASGRNVLWATERLVCAPALKTLLLLQDVDRAFSVKSSLC